MRLDSSGFRQARVVVLALAPTLGSLGLPWDAFELAFQEAWLRSLTHQMKWLWWFQLQHLDGHPELLGLWPDASYRPLVFLGLLGDWSVGQGAAWVSRLAGLVVSASSCALLVNALARRLSEQRQSALLLVALWWWHPAWIAAHLSVFGRADLHATFGASLLIWSLSQARHPSPRGRAVQGLVQLLACTVLCLSHEVGAFVALGFGTWQWTRGGAALCRFGRSAPFLLAGLFAISRHLGVHGGLQVSGAFWSQLAATWGRLHGSALVPWLVPEVCSVSAASDPLLPSLGAAIGAAELLLLLLLLIWRRRGGARLGLSVFLLALADAGVAVALGEATGRWGASWPLAGWAVAFWMGGGGAERPSSRSRQHLTARASRFRALLHRVQRGSALHVRKPVRTIVALFLLLVLLTLSTRRTVLGFAPQRYWAEQLRLCPRDLALVLPLSRAESRSGERLAGLVRLKCAWQTGVVQEDERVVGQSLLQLLHLLRTMTLPRRSEIVEEHARFLEAVLNGRATQLTYGTFSVPFAAHSVERRAVELSRPTFLVLWAEALADLSDPAAPDVANQAAALCTDCRDIARRSSRVSLRFARFVDAERIMERADLVDFPYFGARSFRAFSRELRALHDAAVAGGNQYLFFDFDLRVGNEARAFQRLMAFPQLVESLESPRRIALAEMAYAAGYTEWAGRLIRKHLSGRQQAEFLGRMLFETERALPPAGHHFPTFEIGRCDRLIVPKSKSRR